MKICSKCKIDKELSKFAKQSTGKSGFTSQCKDCKNNVNKIYRLDNPSRQKIYKKNRRQNDILFRLTSNISALIFSSFKRGSYLKTSKTQDILGCSFEAFKSHIESQFEPWMTWDNQGKYNGDLNFGWDIDHIIPVSSAGCETRLKLLNHYTNLQPLCSKINRDIKKDNVTWNYSR